MACVIQFLSTSIIVLLIAIMGLICGILGAFSCEFYSTGNGDIREAISNMGLTNLADVGQLQFGIFSYENIAGECVDYPNGPFSDMLGWNSMLQISQILAAVSIGFGALGILLTLIELMVCNFMGSCTFGMFSFLVAWATMAAAFGLFIVNNVGAGFCGENTNQGDNINININVSDCDLDGPAAGLLIWSIICYFIASCVMCCIPRPDAWMKEDDEDKDANASDVEESAIPVATATDTRAGSDTPPSETMASAVTGVASVSEPATQVVEEVAEA